jgi:ribosomal protein S18 acetylase RimI-like enzyme
VRRDARSGDLRLLPDETEAFIRMRREALDLEPSAFLASPDDDRALDPSFVRESFSSSSQATFGAFAPDLVGMVGIGRESRRKAAHKAYVWGRYVRAARRRSDVGRSLMIAALQFARGLEGVTHVHLGVAEGNASALRLYESLGFVAWGKEPDALRIGGEPVTEYHMVLELNARAV